MDLSNKTTKIGIGLLALLLIAGLTLFYSGSDAVAVALEKKEGILTAEQVKVAFDSVGGRMVNEAVQEGQTVKKGDVLMVIDSTDVDLATQKLKAQIAQLDATIRSQEESVRLGFSRIENDEVGPALLADVLDAGIVLDLCGKRDGLERSVLSSHPSAVMLNRAHPLFNRAEIALPELDGAVLYLPGTGEEFEPLFCAVKQAGAEPDFTVLHSFYQVLYHVRDLGGTALNRYVPGEDIDPSLIRPIPLHGLPPLCSSFLTREGEASPPLQLLRDWLTAKLREDFAR